MEQEKKKKILLVLHNLPNNMSVRSIKKFIKDNCGAKAVGLRNLMDEGQVKRITVRLFEESDAALLVRNINGMFLGRHQLFVEDVHQKKNSNVNLDMETAVNPQLQVSSFNQPDLSFGHRQLENQNRWIKQPAVSYPHNKVLLRNNSTFTNFNPDTYIQGSTDCNTPPSKMPRLCNLNVDKFGNSHPATTVTNDDTFANKSVKMPLSPQFYQHSNVFSRAAGIIAEDMMRNAKVRFLTNYAEVYQRLKKYIESRIDVIMEDKVPNTLDEVIQCYRLKFAIADDPQFFKAVMEKTQRGTSNQYTSVNDDDIKNMSFVAANQNPGVSANQQTQGFEIDKTAGQISNTNEMPKPSGTEKPNSPASNVPVQQEQFSTLPRSKQVFKEQKKLSSMVCMIEDMYNPDSALFKALDEELHKLCEVFLMGSSQPEVDEDEEKFRLMLRNRTSYTFKKVMRIRLSKRLLNIADNLVIRIFVNPPTSIKREDLDQFLKEKGITYVKKTVAKKLYVAVAPNYEVYDNLLAMKHVIIGDCCLEFNPLYLVGIPKKHLQKKIRRLVEEDDDESVDDEELERLIEETENKVIKKTELVNVALTGNVKQFAGTVVELLDDDDDKIVPRGPHAGGVGTKRDGKKEIKDEGAHGTSLGTKVVTEYNDKAHNVQVDDLKTKTDVDGKESIEVINKEADEPEKGNEMINEENLCAVVVDDDDLEDF